jgi:hypothetical protein
VVWVLLLGAMAARYALPTNIALIRYVEGIVTVLISNLFRLAGAARRASHGLHAARQR